MKLNLTQHNYSMKSKEEIEQLAFLEYPRLINDPYNPMVDDNADERKIWINAYTQCQEDMADNNLSNEVLFKQAIVAMEEHYGYGCETEIDAYFRGLKWMQKQYNKQD